MPAGADMVQGLVRGEAGPYDVLLRAVRGFLPSIAAVGLARAWLSFQTGVCLSYGTSFVARDGLTSVQPLSLVLLSVAVALVGDLRARRGGRELLSVRRAAFVLACGVLGCLSYVTGLLWGGALPVLGTTCAALMIACFLGMMLTWFVDNVSPDFPAVVTRLGLSFLVQYGAYALVLALPHVAQCFAVAVVPLLVAALALKPPVAEVPAGEDGPDAPAVSRRTLFALVAIVAACCTAHGFLFRFNAQATGVWIVGPLCVGLAICALAARRGGRSALFRDVLLLTVSCQSLGVVIMLLFSYDGEWTSLSKSLSYAGSMTLTMALGAYLASSRGAGRGAHAFGWLALYFATFYAANYLMRILNLEQTVPLAAILMCLLGSSVAVVMNDWAGLGRAMPGCARPSAETCEPGLAADAAGLAALGLTQRETDVLRGLLDGRTFKQIAQENGVSVNTVRAQSQSLYRKLDVHGRDELAERVRSL